MTQEEPEYVVLPKHALYDLGHYVIAVLKKGLEAYVENEMGNAGKYLPKGNNIFDEDADADARYQVAVKEMVATYKEVIKWCDIVLDDTYEVSQDSKDLALHKIGNWLADNVGWLWS